MKIALYQSQREIPTDMKCPLLGYSNKLALGMKTLSNRLWESFGQGHGQLYLYSYTYRSFFSIHD